MQGRWGRLVRISGPGCAKLGGEGLRDGITGPDEGEDFAPLVNQDLGDDVSSGSKAVDAHALPGGVGVGNAQGAVADESGAQERCGLDVVEPVGQGEAVAGVGHELFGVASVECVAGELGGLAQIFAAALAEAARAAGKPEPRYAHALPR